MKGWLVYMVGIIEKVKLVLSGRILMDNRLKFKILGFCVSGVHLLFGIMMGWLHIMPLFWYNLAVTVFYIYLAMVLSVKEKYLTIYITMFVEIMFYASMATMFVGWSWGFMLYTVGLIPASFYLSYTLPGMERRVSIPVLTSMGVGICYIAVDLAARYNKPLYSVGIPESVVSCFHYFNTTLIFVMLVTFSTLFALELRYMQRLTERKNDRLEEIAYYDPLTGLLNRRSMDKYLRAALNKATQEKPFCLLMVDIDDFKKVNDTYGHDFGDRVLKAVSTLISENVRETDYICRWGGEEFLILLRTSMEYAKQIAEYIRCSVEEEKVCNDAVQIHISITIGIAQYYVGATVQALIQEADERLYYGKRHGKNQVCCGNN